MKKLTLATAIVFLIGCGAPPRDIDTDALAEAHDHAWNRHDAAAMAALFAPDATLVTPRGTRVEGREALAEVLGQPGPTKQTTSTTRFVGVQ